MVDISTFEARFEWILIEIKAFPPLPPRNFNFFNQIRRERGKI